MPTRLSSHAIYNEDRNGISAKPLKNTGYVISLQLLLWTKKVNRFPLNGYSYLNTIAVYLLSIQFYNTSKNTHALSELVQ